MGQQQSIKQPLSELNLQSQGGINKYRYQIPLSDFKQFQYEKNHMISSINANSKLTVFQKTQQIPTNIGNLIAINTQLVYKEKKTTDIEAIENIIKYYEIRKRLNEDHEIDDNIIKLFSFQVENNKTKQKIFPQIAGNAQKGTNNQSNKQNRFGAMCSFDLFNSRNSLQKTKSIIDRKGCYQFKFLYEFYLNNLQKEIQVRASNNSLFLQKEIWSLLWCCVSVASKMINLGLKQPMLSPACIFISQQSLIKVGEWEFSSYYVHNKKNQSDFEQEEGQTILNLNLQQQQIQCDSNDDKNILMKYYWAPEGLIQMQKVISLGQTVKSFSKSQRKNSQMFSLGMTIVQMCSLNSNYQKSTYSEKQLSKIINKTIQFRKQSKQPLSDEMVTFIRRMLTWDCQDRVTYQQALQYIQTYFTEHESIFQQQDLDLQKSSRNLNNFKNSTQQQFQSMFTQQSINLNFNCNEKIMIQSDEPQSNYEYLYQEKESTGSTHLNLNGSGLITQGQGDTFLPEENQVLQAKINYNYNSSSCLQNVFPLAPDFPDFQNFNDVGLQQTFENYRYDEDEFQYLRNSKQQIQFQINQPNNYFNIDQGLSASNKSYKKINQQNQEDIVFVQNKSKKNIKNYYQQLQKVQNVQVMKMNIWNSKNENSFSPITNGLAQENPYDYCSNSFENTFNNRKKEMHFKSRKEQQENQLANKLHHFQIKMTYSPSVVASQQYSSITANKQSLFTDPTLMAMIKQYSSRKQINQQPKNTPKQNYHQTTIQNEQFKQQNLLNAVQQKKSSRSKKNQINYVKEEFSRGLYQGSKKSGMRNGYGTFHYKEGGKYSGYWLDNQMEGHGTLYYPDGRIAYQGQWRSDSLHGKGVLHNQRPVQIKYQYDYSSFSECQSDQCWVYYDGWFQRDQKSGFGQILLSNGQKYVGQFKNDMIHGKGKFYVLSGQIIQGYWQNNQLVQIINQNQL